ncbi:MAG TPA: amidohydrolase [Bacillota bacterium]|nr:amidohydrolase [Bacillota bacterium]HPZ90235.1 amidohydrolase [Bacillota bacterium]HQE01625.1 amidohydrolase [Bacillota bacterium]
MRAIVNGKICTMAGAVLEKGTILIEAGKIKAVGADLAVPPGAEIIDAQGGYVLPGIIDAHTHIGVYEEGIGFEGADGNEMTNPATPHIRALDAVNPADKAFAGARAGGVTSLAVAPGSANVIGGQVLAMKTWGRVVDDMVIRAPLGLKVAFGENPKRVYSNQKKSPSTRMAVAAILRENLTAARNYLDKLERAKDDPEKAPDRDLKLEILAKVLRKEIPLRAHAHRADDIITAVRIAEEFDVDIVIEHCTEGHLIADFLAEKGVPAIIGPTLGTRPKVELVNATFRTPGILHKAGVKVALTSDHPVFPVQQLPIQAALVHKHGLPEEEALKAITINAAEILGIANRVGSLEPGKDADIVIFSGHPFHWKTRVEKTLIDGEIVYER